MPFSKNLIVSSFLSLFVSASAVAAVDVGDVAGNEKKVRFSFTGPDIDNRYSKLVDAFGDSAEKGCADLETGKDNLGFPKVETVCSIVLEMGVHFEMHVSGALEIKPTSADRFFMNDVSTRQPLLVSLQEIVPMRSCTITNSNPSCSTRLGPRTVNHSLARLSDDFNGDPQSLSGAVFCADESYSSGGLTVLSGCYIFAKKDRTAVKIDTNLNCDIENLLYKEVGIRMAPKGQPGSNVEIFLKLGRGTRLNEIHRPESAKEFQPEVDRPQAFHLQLTDSAFSGVIGAFGQRGDNPDAGKLVKTTDIECLQGESVNPFDNALRVVCSNQSNKNINLYESGDAVGLIQARACNYYDSFR